MPPRHPVFNFAAPSDQVFNFLADIENLPFWLGGFCDGIELHRDGWWAYTILGELEIETQVDANRGEIRLGLRPVGGQERLIKLCVRSEGAGETSVGFECSPLAENESRLIAAFHAGLQGWAAGLRAELAV